MKIYIRAMSEARKDIERKLSGENLTKLIIHILYIVLNPTALTVEHWMDEIHSFISDVDKLKGKNKFPPASDIYKWTYGKKQDLVTDYGWLRVKVRDACKKENIVTELSIEQISKYTDKICIQYFKWLADELSKYGAVANDDVHDKLYNIIHSVIS